MSRVTETGMAGAGEGSSSARSDEPEARSEVRWSARRKEGVVMRLLRGESLDLLARETNQPAGRIASWRVEFLAAGGAAQGRRALDGERHPQGAVGAQGPPSVAEALSVSEQLPAPLQVVCRVARVSRSAACEARRRRGTSEPLRRRPGPVGAMSDRELPGSSVATCALLRPALLPV
jgi:transposase-like protein